MCIGDSLTEGDYGVYGKSGIANVCEKNYPYFLSQMLNVPVINNKDIMRPNDELHSSEAGYRVLASFIAQRIKDELRDNS